MEIILLIYYRAYSHIFSITLGLKLQFVALPSFVNKGIHCIADMNT